MVRVVKTEGIDVIEEWLVERLVIVDGHSRWY